MSWQLNDAAPLGTRESGSLLVRQSGTRWPTRHEQFALNCAIRSAAGICIEVGNGERSAGLCANRSAAVLCRELDVREWRITAR